MMDSLTITVIGNDILAEMHARVQHRMDILFLLECRAKSLALECSIMDLPALGYVRVASYPLRYELRHRSEFPQ